MLLFREAEALYFLLVKHEHVLMVMPKWRRARWLLEVVGLW